MPKTTPAPIGADALRPIITWLDNGCEPMQAAEELRLLVQRADALVSAAQPVAVPHAQMTEEIDNILSDPDTRLSPGTERVLRWLRTWTDAPLVLAAAPKAAPAPSVTYTELPDFDTVEQRIYAGCRRFISEAIDADRAFRGQAPAPAAAAGPLNELEELNLLNKLIDLGARAAAAHAKSNSDDGHAGTAAYVEWTELRADMRELIRKSYAAPIPAAQGDALDTERLDWLTFNISGKALRDIGVIWSEHGDARRAIDAARAAKEGDADAGG